ncbi:MAG: cation diffusion facilitator family transporter [Acidobacteriota bacterium]
MTGRRIALLSIAVSGSLAAAKLVIGWLAGSTAVVADGFESAGDVVTSSILLLGLAAASRPPDQEHPYGHGRLEMLTGLAIGVILAAAGAGICVHSLERLAQTTAPALYGIWPLVASIALKGGLSALKFRHGRRLRSAALIADAWNDTVDILSGTVALVALGLTLAAPSRFLEADHWGGFAVGLIVVFTGLRVVHSTALQLMDTMPDGRTMEQIRAVALQVPGVKGVEKCFARKTGFQYHVDLHLEVDPDITVRESHDIATEVRIRLKETLDYIADVLVHVEPAP